MPITVTSGGVAAVCAVLGTIGAFGLWAVQAIVARELRKLNGRYLYAAGSELTGHEIEGRLVALEVAKAAGGGD